MNSNRAPAGQQPSSPLSSRCICCKETPQMSHYQGPSPGGTAPNGLFPSGSINGGAAGVGGLAFASQGQPINVFAAQFFLESNPRTPNRNNIRRPPQSLVAAAAARILQYNSTPANNVFGMMPQPPASFEHYQPPQYYGEVQQQPMMQHPMMMIPQLMNNGTFLLCTASQPSISY